MSGKKIENVACLYMQMNAYLCGILRKKWNNCCLWIP